MKCYLGTCKKMCRKEEHSYVLWTNPGQMEKLRQGCVIDAEVQNSTLVENSVIKQETRVTKMWIGCHVLPYFS